MEACITEAYASFGVAPLGGASLDGWSKLADFQRCPYRYWLIHEQPKTDDLVSVGAKPVALELGSLFHAMLALHYMPASYGPYPTPYALAERVASFGATVETVDEAKRLYNAYFCHYGNAADEKFTPLGVEVPCGLSEVHTSRLDLVASIGGATWIVEHKTASRETRDVLEGWWLDGEIIGEVLAYRISNFTDKYGPLAGVLVNITIKTKEPKFRRVEVVVTDDQLERYARDVDWWRKHRRQMRLDPNGYWPRKLQGCIGRYDTCTFWDHCRDANATDDARLNRLLTQSLEKGETDK